MIRGGVKLGKNLRSTATECRLRPDGTRITLASAGTKWSRPSTRGGFATFEFRAQVPAARHFYCTVA